MRPCDASSSENLTKGRNLGSMMLDVSRNSSRKIIGSGSNSSKKIFKTEKGGGLGRFLETG